MQTSKQVISRNDWIWALIFSAALILLSSCAGKTSKSAETVKAKERIAKAPVTSLAVSKTLADKQLEDLHTKEITTFLQLTVTAEDYDEEEKERLLEDLIREYDRYISRNPEYALGYVFYGKFLRRVNESREANRMFMKANELDPNIPSVKQQIGNFLAEEGAFEFALPYFLAAIELSPDTAVYHYQLGELLYTFKGAYIADKIFTLKTLEIQMMDAFKQAAILEPENRDFQYRYTEAFYDIDSPNWTLAL